MKKISMLIVLSLVLMACTTTPKPVDPSPNINKDQELYLQKLNFKFTLLNEKESEGYQVYFMLPDQRDEMPGSPNMRDVVGPYIIQDDMSLSIDLLEDPYIRLFLSENESFELDLFVVSLEDFLIMNPLNEPTRISFKSFTDDHSSDYYVNTQQYEISIKDTYPEGVISLPFPDATFVVKLKFNDPDHHENYVVTIALDDPNAPDGIGIVNLGGLITRPYQYYNGPFFESDNLNSVSGTILVRETTNNQIVQYKGYPKKVSFDKDGFCLEGDTLVLEVDPS